MKTTTDTITTEQITALLYEAGEAGDAEQVAICNRALGGDTDAITECARVIDDAAAQDDSDAITAADTTYTVTAEAGRDEGSYIAASPEAAIAAHLRFLGYTPDSDDWCELAAGLTAEPTS